MRRLVAQIAACLAVTLLALPTLADDGQIAKQIIAQLKEHKQTANLKGFDLGVKVDGGTVTMMGQVASPEQAMLALDTARRIQGVKLVVNDLYVNQVAQPAPMVGQTRMAQPQAQMAQPTIQPVSAQQPVMAQQPTMAQPRMAAPQGLYQQPAMVHYNATGAVGSAVARQPLPQRPVPIASSSIRQASAVAPANYVDGGYVEGGGYGGGEVISGGGDMGYGGASMSGSPSVPGYSWPSYAASPNYGAVTYPSQYSATAWPYIGPFYPYPQVPLGWRKVSLEWDDGWWFLDFTKK